MIASIAAAALLLSSYSAMDEPDYPVPATVNLSAIRHLICDNDKWQGSGFLIGDHIIVTAHHMIADGPCIDEETGLKLVTYKDDPKHDLALLTNSELPTDMPYIKISCQPFKKGQDYYAYGITDYGEEREILRENTIRAGKYGDFLVEGLYGHMQYHMRYFSGPIAPGMSGGPVVDGQGYAYAVNNAASDTDTLLYEFKDGILCQK
jgi:S1-C subfamily serine protease